jgi:hypothetical protein
MGEKYPTVLVVRDQIIENDRDTELELEIIYVPRVVISDKIRDRNAGIRPFGKKTLKPRKTFRNHVSILDIILKHVAEQIQVLDLLSHRSQEPNQIRFPRALRLPIGSAEVKV